MKPTLLQTFSLLAVTTLALQVQAAYTPQETSALKKVSMRCASCLCLILAARSPELIQGFVFLLVVQTSRRANPLQRLHAPG